MFNKEEGSIIYTYQVLTGNNAGVYERYLVGQSASSYDLDRSEELEYWSENVMPYAEAVGGQMRWQWEEWATVGDQPEPPKYINKYNETLLWAHRDLNPEPADYESVALTN